MEALPCYKTKKEGLRTLLQYHTRKSHILPIRRHVYSVVARGATVEEAPYATDHLLLASKLTTGAVIAYVSALDYYGCLHSAHFDVVYLGGINDTNPSQSRFEYGGCTYRCTLTPAALKQKKAVDFEVCKGVRSGQTVWVTSLERAFVDVLDRPELMAYDWEEIARSLEKVYLSRPSALIEYLKLLDSRTTASRVGFFLERNQKQYGIPQEVIDQVQELSAKRTVHLDPRNKQKSILSKKWNLMVPVDLYNSTWEEIQ